MIISLGGDTGVGLSALSPDEQVRALVLVSKCRLIGGKVLREHGTSGAVVNLLDRVVVTPEVGGGGGNVLYDGFEEWA